MTIPVPVFVAVTVTPGISAPDASDTVPPTVALVDWANACNEKVRHSSNAAVKANFFTYTPLNSSSTFSAAGNWADPVAKVEKRLYISETAVNWNRPIFQRVWLG